MKICYCKFAVLTFLSALMPVIAQAAVPRAMLENSTTYALNNSVHAFRVPTVNSLGQIKFYNVIIDLNVNASGLIGSTANVVSSLSPNVATGVVVPGTYKETGGTDTCKVTNITLTNGRIQSSFICNNGANVFEFSVATGPVTAGHPYFAELSAKGVKLRSDVATQTWGLITGGSLFLGTCSGNGAYPIGVKTNGSQIILSVFNPGTSTVAAIFRCGNTLTKI